jgi:AcrR family transcriptional regulator
MEAVSERLRRVPPVETLAEAASVCQPRLMPTAGTTTKTPTEANAEPIAPLAARSPKRADARRNHERVLAAAREAFAEGGESTALEQIARRAGVGIGTLYRHFPNRQALLEALYVSELEQISRSAATLDDPDPWRTLNAWFERLVAYLATKRALANELLNYLDPDAPLFTECRASLFAAGEPLLKRAQDAGVVRPDVDFSDVLHMVGGITKMPVSAPGQTEHVLRVALDGLRYRRQP